MSPEAAGWRRAGTLHFLCRGNPVWLPSSGRTRRSAPTSTSGWLGGRTHSTTRLAHRTRLMECLQLPICLHDHGELAHDVRNVRAGNRIVTLVVPQAGVHAVADAAEARGRPP